MVITKKITDLVELTYINIQHKFWSCLFIVVITITTT
jgi:hypothetical protein